MGSGEWREKSAVGEGEEEGQGGRRRGKEV